MTTVTRATAARQFPKFIADVIKENVSDLSNRVFKSTVEDPTEIALPCCYLDVDSMGSTKIVVTGEKHRTSPLVVTIEVWANKIVDRDTIADSIMDTLRDPDSTDGTDSMKSKYIMLNTINSFVNDRIITGFKKIVRVSTINATFASYG